MKCTIKDIANELNMSRNTVSKALNGGSGVSDNTRKLIQEKARDMNYKNTIAQYHSNKSNTNVGSIMFLTKGSANYSEFWTNVLRGIESILRPNNYDLVIGIMSESDLKNLNFPSTIQSGMIKGIILVEINYEQVINSLSVHNIPLVTVDMPRDYERIMGKLDIITMENKINLKKIISELIYKGAKRFAYVGDIYSKNSGRGFKERYDALCETLEINNLELDEETTLSYETEEDFINSSYLIKKINSMDSLPDVFICGNDWTAIKLMHSLQFLGYKIPKDVSIVGFDNIPESSKVYPQLTTINTPKEQLGIAAAQCILERIKNPNMPYVYSQYTTNLIKRDSTI